MLAADKLLLECRIARNTTELKRKEFSLHHLNLTTVGTQAAVLAGFGATALIEFGPPKDADRGLLFLFWTCNMISLASNVLCLAETTMLSVCASSLSTRGADGSMVRAVDGIYQLRRRVFYLFWLGVVSTLLSGVFGAWIIFGAVEASLLSSILVAALVAFARARRSIKEAFFFAPCDAVSFDDLRRVAGARV
mmetsp:Transcript_29464/g.91092  ORF Transcript_29464/g.91092 Transcript_29464/m.91092 type:complete len:193 (+) Transcript_29464:292-870(+)